MTARYSTALTERQQQIYDMLASGMSYGSVARQLGMAKGSVQSIAEQALFKLRVASIDAVRTEVHELPFDLKLSLLERIALAHWINGKCQNDVATEMNIARATAAQLIWRAYKKLGVHSKSEVIALCRQKTAA